MQACCPVVKGKFRCPRGHQLKDRGGGGHEDSRGALTKMPAKWQQDVFSLQRGYGPLGVSPPLALMNLVRAGRLSTREPEIRRPRPERPEAPAVSLGTRRGGPARRRAIPSSEPLTGCPTCRRSTTTALGAPGLSGTSTSIDDDRYTKQPHRHSSGMSLQFHRTATDILRREAVDRAHG